MLGIMLKMNNVLNKNTVLERDVQKMLTQESLQQESLQQDQREMRTRAVDARIVKSRQSLRDALINLIEEKGFDALTVQPHLLIEVRSITTLEIKKIFLPRLKKRSCKIWDAIKFK